MKVWITRDKTNSGDVCIWKSKPTIFRQMFGINGDVGDDDFRVGAFKKLFGFTPHKGSIGQYELSLKVIT
jgi:hypothetical protein